MPIEKLDDHKDMDLTPEYRGHDIEDLMHLYSDQINPEHKKRFAEMVALVFANYCFGIGLDAEPLILSAKAELDSFSPPETI